MPRIISNGFDLLVASPSPTALTADGSQRPLTIWRQIQICGVFFVPFASNFRDFFFIGNWLGEFQRPIRIFAIRIEIIVQKKPKKTQKFLEINSNFRENFKLDFLLLALKSAAHLHIHLHYPIVSNIFTSPTISSKYREIDYLQKNQIINLPSSQSGHFKFGYFQFSVLWFKFIQRKNNSSICYFSYLLNDQ